MANLLTPVSLDELTAIRARFFLARSSRAKEEKILVVKYEGAGRSGVDGELDGRFMLAMGKAALTAWEPDGLVIDLTDLDFRQLVEGLASLLYLGAGVFGHENLPQAVVVGPGCEEAIRSFFSEPTRELAHDLASAMDYVEEEMAKLDARFSR